MKNLNTFIKEAFNSYQLDSVEVKYDCFPESIVFECPETFQESDIQQYIDDKFLPELPSNEKYAKKHFGKNFENIYDVYFKYETFEHLSEDYNGEVNYKWDSKYGYNLPSNINLNYFKINKLAYYIKFDRFELENNNTNYKDVLNKIFKASESNAYNEYPIKIKYDENSLIYKEI